MITAIVKATILADKKMNLGVLQTFYSMNIHIKKLAAFNMNPLLMEKHLSRLSAGKTETFWIFI